MLEGWFLWLMLAWIVIMIVLLSIAGFFMFSQIFKKAA